MNYQEIAQELSKKYPKMEVDYLPRKGRIVAYNTANAVEELKAIGFEISPNSATLRFSPIFENDAPVGVSAEQMAKSESYWSR